MNILFVDDENDVLEGYKRMLFPMKDDWPQFFSSNGNHALEILKKENIDVIVCDLRMPIMDGAVLLDEVKKLYPNILRLVLSGYQNDMKAIRATGVAHQFISKPCSAQSLKTTIEKSMFLKKYINNEQMLSVITGLGELPGLPDVYLKIEEEINETEVSLKYIADIIAQDISLVAKILQTVNSSFFGLRVRITNILEALSFLGVNIIKSLILYLKVFSLTDMSPKKINFCESVGKHSTLVAKIAQNISKEFQSEKYLDDDSYTAGVLHDIGKIILLHLPDYEKNVQSLSNNRHLTYDEAEQELYGFSHAEAGAYLLGIWGLPETIVEATALHHQPQNIKHYDSLVLTSVHIANSFVNKRHTESIEKLSLENINFYFPKLDLHYIESINLKNKIIYLYQKYGQIEF
jgi:HD-like signal output (HDOD) protein